jgi:GNAT superfamily N-acetyltransferase
MDYLGSLEVLQEKDIDEAAALIANAFLHSPGYCYVYQGLDEDGRRGALTWLFAKNLRIRLGNGAARCAFLREPGKPLKMACFFMLERPGVVDISAWTMLINGILLLPIRYGLATFQRLFEIKSYAEAAHKEFLASPKAGPASSYCRLERMVVHPSCQGLGVGSRCLRFALDEAASDGLGCMLGTWEERNRDILFPSWFHRVFTRRQLRRWHRVDHVQAATTSSLRRLT